MSYTKVFRFKSIIWFIPLILIFYSACTDLSETVHTQVTPDQFFKNEQQFVSALGDAYTILGTGGGGSPGFGGNGGVSMLQEISSDEVIVPHRGPDWFNNGEWIRIHQQNVEVSDRNLNQAWLQMFAGVNSSNRLIAQFNGLIEDGSVDPELAESFIAELEVLRSYYYYQLLDLFGNVPILRNFGGVEDPSNNSDFQAGRTDVFNFVDSTITANIDKLSTDVSSTYGRINKFVAHMILSKLYLNAEVYTGNAMWEEALAQLELVEEGGYTLADNYSSNFVVNNSGSPEIIFAIPYDRVQLTGFNLVVMTFHYQQQSTFQLEQQPWNGHSTLAEFYKSYIDPSQNPGPQGEIIQVNGNPGIGTLDDRRANFSVGLQRSFDGEVIEDGAFNVTNDQNDELRGTVDDSAEVRLTPRIDELEPNANRQAGARILKYEIEPGINTDMNNDFVIFRFADVLLMKAEALMRLNRDQNQALQYVNMIRERAGVDPWQINELTMDNLLAERGRELFYEFARRQDLIRFEGKEGETRFNDSWEFKEVTNPNVNVFPIPLDQMEANSNLNQNPGFN